MRSFSIFAVVCAFALLPASLHAAGPDLSACAACHGENGESLTPEIPSLGGQPAPYLLIQLYLFREKQRRVEVMNQATEKFSDDDLRSVSDSLAKLPAPAPHTNGADVARMAHASALVSQHRCNSCHGLDLTGRDNVPRIARQREDYLLKALREFKNNSRHGYDGAMADVMASVTEDDINDLSYYIARFQ